MAEKTLINGIATNEISSLDRGLQYGDGVFETIAVEKGKLLCWDEHLARLESGCQCLNIPCPDKALLKDETTSLVNSSERSVTKLIITRGQGGRGYTPPEEAKPSRIISLHPYPDYPEEYSTQGVNIRTCNYRYAHNKALAGIKHLNRLEQVLARSEWKDTAIAEGLVLDQNKNVIEGTMSNVFCVIDNVLCTPDLTLCGVEGVIRNKIIELASSININVEVKELSLEKLNEATEIFVCNSVIGVWSVKMLDDKKLSVSDKTKEIKLLLQKNNCISSSC
jgi:4-amino-4-deoxychorismate lyase